ncbi:hypothetical protein KIL84_015377 [Mauremys mutica]|uniref:Uncharacterized protein n=1 Tax=Mauremys mutica TaxID=74926 RepID=A0A9D3WSB2_9SAUR|nr:hypothetical protein KIL84_015377 [Mauremys mutica]
MPQPRVISLCKGQCLSSPPQEWAGHAVCCRHPCGVQLTPHFPIAPKWEGNSNLLLGHTHSKVGQPPVPPQLFGALEGEEKPAHCPLTLAWGVRGHTAGLWRSCYSP